MDVLSDILRSVRLSGGVHFRCEFSAPWGMQMKRSDAAEFHVVVRGNCWLRMEGRREPIALQGGDLLVLPHGGAHSLMNAPDSATRPAEDIVGGQSLEHYGPVTAGGGGVPASVLCGYFRFDRDRPHPLVAALPSLIHLRGTDSYELTWLQTALNFMVHETRNARPGGEAVVNRLAEVLFVQVVRSYIAQSESPPAMLAAIADRQIGAALQLMHQSVQQPWTVASLGQRIGMSRSAFAARFSELVGHTPMQYLMLWRMQKARHLLGESRLATAAIAERVGYQSEAAFSRAFKTAVGEAPGAYRRKGREDKSV
jgi:AraC-like DNA-binding protein